MLSGADGYFEEYFDELARRLRDASPEMLDDLCQVLVGAQEQGRRVFLAGNGGSAAIASHVAVDLTKTLGMRAVNFNEADLITCFANDYGYEHWIAKAIESYGEAGDTVVLISSSGKSRNVVNAAECARERGLRVVTLSGFEKDNPLRAIGDLNLWVNSRRYNIVETTHQSWLLAAADNLVRSRSVS
jgi:D-sedoheptulose 7-phosphate isomerase